MRAVLVIGAVSEPVRDRSICRSWRGEIGGKQTYQRPAQRTRSKLTVVDARVSAVRISTAADPADTGRA